MTLRSSAALLGVALAATTAGAQAPAAAAAKCDIQSGGSPQITAAYDALGKFNATNDAAEQRKHLQAAVKQLSGAADKQATDVARNWVLGQALVAWTLVPNQATEGPRADFGYATDPQARIDLLAAADSAFDVVEAKMPGCKQQTTSMRMLPYNATANAAVQAFNAGQLDEAKALAERAARIYDVAPHVHHLLGNIAIKQQQYREAIPHLEAAVEQAQGDTTLKEVRYNALDNLAVLVANEAATATGDEQKALAAKAAGYYRQILEAKPTDAAAQTGLAQTLALSGDTTAVAGIYSKMVADVGSYSSNQLLDAGIGAANAGRTDDAVTLLTAGLRDNPFYRDGLFALAIMYLNQQKYDSVATTATKLVAIDPSNPDNHALLAQAYEGIISTATDNKVKKAYADSMLKTQQRAQRMPVRVTFNDFQNLGSEQRVLNGSIENLTDAPATYVLKVEFLDKSGNVVATKEETVSDVQGKGSKTFSISVQQAGVVAYRYAPLSS